MGRFPLLNTKTTIISPDALAQQMAICGEIRSWWQEQGITPVAFVDTYGCQQNEADSEQIRGMLHEAGYGFTDTEEGADIIVLNTCAVREHAEQRVFGNVGALVHTKRRHSRQKIFLCGCMMGQKAVSERIKHSYPHVDGVFSTHHLWEFPRLLLHVLKTGKRIFAVEDSAGAIAEGLPVCRTNTLKAWVSVMYGCNNFCSYCIVPYVRGRERSRRPEDILRECRELIAQGYKEITLLGQNVNSYGKDLGLGIDFADLLASVAELEGDFRLRFMTSHPKDASFKLFDTIAKYDKICKQFHLPFQSGNDRVLKEMNRRYTAEQYLKLVEYGRSRMPELVLTSDVIVGFPGETEEEFEDTLKLIEKVGYDALFTFIYSPRGGTPAASMPDPFTKADKNRRFDRLVQLQNRISEEKHRAYIGTVQRVLVDGRDGNLLTARTDGGRLVRFPGADSLIGQFLDVEITDCTTWSLVGKRKEA
ncbi:MAG: tRNA (N6-isopentenyl adenosine(37)-C2)-methylthiotransferase MiaB [Oscillospiraceae bacterium]|nr:tRNA (N6-isopentenyl adenosine(37)-C2)-methylthiotransferase MiaB [Oscillospiraceae bacterium]